MSLIYTERFVYINCGDMPAKQALSLFAADRNYEADVVRVMRSATCIMKSRKLHVLSEFRIVKGKLVARTNHAGQETIALSDIVEVTRKPILELLNDLHKC